MKAPSRGRGWLGCYQAEVTRSRSGSSWGHDEGEQARAVRYPFKYIQYQKSGVVQATETRFLAITMRNLKRGGESSCLWNGVRLRCSAAVVTFAGQNHAMQAVDVVETQFLSSSTRSCAREHRRAHPAVIG